MYKNIILLIVSFTISVVFLELALRVVLPPPIIWEYPQEQYLFDPEIGHRLKPEQLAFTHDKPVQINSMGIRDVEYAETAQKKVYRILALGDSQTFGNGIELVHSWPKQLEKILNNTSDDVSYEVINSGLPGSDTWQHEIINRRFISRYHPDAVVLAMYVNDIVTRFKPKKKKSETANELQTKFFYLLKRSVLLLSLRNASQSIQQLMSPGRGHTHQQAVLKGISGPSVDKAWQQVDASLLAIKELCDQKRVKFVVASIPRRDQVYSQLPSKDYNQRLREIADRHQIPLVGLLKPLQKAYTTHGEALFIPWDGHNTEIANDVIATQIHERLLFAH